MQIAFVGVVGDVWIVEITSKNKTAFTFACFQWKSFSAQIAFGDIDRLGVDIHFGTIDAVAVILKAKAAANGIQLQWGSLSVLAKVMLPHVAELERLMPMKTPPDLSRFLLCPMPGLVVSLHAVEGQEVKAGDVLAVVEAMKMENVLRAEKDGRVAKVNAKQGDSLAVDAVILEFA